MNLEKVAELKTRKDALILAHNYQRAEVKALADFIGDSLELSKLAAESRKKLIVFCGVRFMAETAKILNPGAKVVIPRIDAGCPLAEMADLDKIRDLKKQYPDAAVCAYVNTYAEVKAVADVCCTSSNAKTIVEKLPNDKVIMLPDANLGGWVAGNTKKMIITYPGSCYVHCRFTREEAMESKLLHPKALFLAHPECGADVLSVADLVASTSGMMRIAAQTDRTELILATEIGVIEHLAELYPGKNIYSAGSAKTCYNMKKTLPSDVIRSLELELTEISLPPEIMESAGKALKLMLELSR
ncbi:MAG: quinolinate synthase NadA [Candidatus Wallbacteria bacterium]|nr:quinolinate synthase NadA [Candidatus Wallbacteria bacterium]